MNTALDMFRSTLRSMFMIDSAEELDFGIYRIMRIKKQEIENWLNIRLEEIVKEQITSNMSSDYGEKKVRLDEKVNSMRQEGYTTSEIDNDRIVKKLRGELEVMGDAEEMQAEVFSHLNTFFSRYYDKGDFVTLRRYKKDVYAIPYEGEEVKLHWANADQYYIKTGEYFKNYRFSLSDGKQVEFTLKDAETPMNDQKSKRELEHHFKLYEKQPLEVDDEGTLHINFVYQLMLKVPNQKTLRNQAYAKILEQLPVEYKELTKEVDEKNHTTLLLRHLTTYTEKNRCDYFIHKDLKGFLLREMDFYIKNEILVIDDIDTTDTKKFLSHLAVIKAVKAVGKSIITLMAQLEEYQKKLWLKKKMVASADFLVTLDHIPASLYEEIGQNDKQREEWVKLYAIDKVKLGKGEIPGMKAEYSVPLTPQFLKENETLVVDTAYFSSEFKHKLLASIDHFDEQCNGLMICSENFQALNLLREKFAEQVKCVYIDPPYNTGGDDFVYKDNYQESSWLSCLYDRLLLTKPFFKEGGSIAVSIDIKELDKLIALMDMTIGSENRKANITVRRASLTGAKVINPGLVNISENVVMYANGNGKWNPQRAYRECGINFKKTRYKSFILNKEQGFEKWEISTVLEVFAKTKNIPKSQLVKVLGDSYEDELYKFMMDNAASICRLAALDEDSVGNDVLDLKKISLDNPDIIYHLQREDCNDYYVINGQAILFFKDRLRKVGDKIVPVEPVSDIWDDVLPNDIHNEGGVVLKKGKKPEKLVDRIFESTTQKGDLVLDYFAGSGTSGAVSLKSGRKFINVEVNEYFDTIPLRRIKNTLYGDTSGVTDKYEWKGGGIVKYIRLEQYEDTLNNIELKENHLAMDVKFDESYILGYMLDVESRESLMNLTRFEHPFTPKMKITHGTVREEQYVDLPETFNYLIGLYVDRYEWPMDGMQVVSGETRRGENTLVIWRDIDSVDDATLSEYVNGREDIKKYRRIYVNCDNNLAATLPITMAERVALTETEFLKKMFDIQAV